MHGNFGGENLKTIFTIMFTCILPMECILIKEDENFTE